MIYLDIGGTKTLISFSKKKSFELFLNYYKEPLKVYNKEKTIKIPSIYITKTKNSLLNFLNNLIDLDKEKKENKIFISFASPIYNGKIASSKFPSLKGLNIEKNFPNGVKIINDLIAFSLYTSNKHFSSNKNRKDKLLNVQIGTGLNAVPVSYQEFKELSFVNNFYESGHIPLTNNGCKIKCYCGRNNCAELFLSAKFLKEKSKDMAYIFHNSKFKEEYYNNLSEYLISLIISTGVNKVYLGGGLSNFIDKDYLKNKIDNQFPFSINYDVEIYIENNELANIYGLKIFEKFLFNH